MRHPPRRPDACVTGRLGRRQKSTLDHRHAPGQAAARRLNGARHRGARPPRHALTGHGAPATRSSRSTSPPSAAPPARTPPPTTGAFTPIRDWFAGLPESAKARGYKRRAASRSTSRAAAAMTCQGDGLIQTVEMHFLPDVHVTCESCAGASAITGARRWTSPYTRPLHRRRPRHAHLRGRRRAASQAVPADPRQARHMLDRRRPRLRQGRPGRPPPCRAARRSASSSPRSWRAAPPASTLYILDEPTTGLHFHDVRRLLLELLHRPGRSAATPSS